MRVTTLLRQLLGVTSLIVESVEFLPEGIVACVRPSWHKPRCGGCGSRAPGYDAKREPRRWRSLSLGAHRVYLQYAMRRVDCRRCGGVRTERVPWAVPGSSFTERFEELTAYLAQRMDKTAVTKLMGVAWSTVGTMP